MTPWSPAGRYRGRNRVSTSHSTLFGNPVSQPLTHAGLLRTLFPGALPGIGNMPQTGDLALLQGTLDVLVLKALMFGPRHGYAVASWIRDTSDETLNVEDRGWVESEWGLSENNRKAKYYQLTARGRAQLRAETTRWTTYAEAVFKVLRAAS